MGETEQRAADEHGELIGNCAERSTDRGNYSLGECSFPKLLQFFFRVLSLPLSVSFRGPRLFTPTRPSETATADTDFTERGILQTRETRFGKYSGALSNYLVLYFVRHTIPFDSEFAQCSS